MENALGEPATRVEDLVPNAAEDADIANGAFGRSVQQQQTRSAGRADTRVIAPCRMLGFHQTAFDCKHPEPRPTAFLRALSARTIGSDWGLVNTPQGASYFRVVASSSEAHATVRGGPSPSRLAPVALNCVETRNDVTTQPRLGMPRQNGRRHLDPIATELRLAPLGEASSIRDGCVRIMDALAVPGIPLAVSPDCPRLCQRQRVEQRLRNYGIAARILDKLSALCPRPLACWKVALVRDRDRRQEQLRQLRPSLPPSAAASPP